MVAMGSGAVVILLGDGAGGFSLPIALDFSGIPQSSQYSR
jgi:hypothetical protein